MNELDKEIERLKIKQAELSGKLSFVNDFELKEKLELQLSSINSQIKTLENFKKRM
jgi:archaellum component FlaC